jgi:putative ABC transport system permease protein
VDASQGRGGDYAPREGPGITIFGRLAPGAALEDAQVELTTLGRRVSAQYPKTHQHLEALVRPYTALFGPSAKDMPFLFLIDLFALLLVVLVCGNVALLLFARAAARESELIVRSALGASRRRLMLQLFAEALVLGGVAAVVGLAASYLTLGQWGLKFLEQQMGAVPFWYDPHLSPSTVLYACALTVFGAVIAGVMPARKITRGLGARLREGTAGGGGLKFGGVWTAVIVAQVAVTVVFPAGAYVMQREGMRVRSLDAGFASHEYLGVRLEMDAPTGAGSDAEQKAIAHRERMTRTLELLRQRVIAEPGVAGVTFVDRLPRDYHAEPQMEVDDQRGDTATSYEVAMAFIDPSYFDVLGAPILAGRGFHAADVVFPARVAIVDQGFVDVVLKGRNPIGRRVRFAVARGTDAGAATQEEPWFEIVGVVQELGLGFALHNHRHAGVYLPAAPGSTRDVHMMAHVRGDPMSLAPRLRKIATEVDPALRLPDIQRVDQVMDGSLWVLGVWLRGTLGLTAIALLLSFAGIYSVLSFTVARRTREIGVRVALGASRRRVIAEIFTRPVSQVAVGVVVGSLLVATAPFVLFEADGLSLRQGTLLVAYALLMMGVCMLACIVPTRRALSVEPTEALRAE